MTVAKSTMRRRRTSMLSMPKAVAAWFAGEFNGTRADGVPWLVLAHPGSALLPDWWASWKADHSKARPPAGFQWLEDPEHPRHRIYSHALAAARRSVASQ